MSRVGDAVADFATSGWGILFSIALLISLIVLIGVSEGRECEKLMSYARTPHDSLEARMACDKMKSDDATAMAIGAAAGAVAGSRR